MPKVLVTGVDQHQGLAVVRGLGMAGIPVLAASPVKRAIGHASRYATERALYTPPQENQERFTADIVEMARRHGASMIMPVSESTLVALDNYRDEVERICPLAAPGSSTLTLAIDKLETARLAGEADVPAPRTCHGSSVGEILDKTRDFRFPVVIKPRGNPLHARTQNHLGFKVGYARTREELREALLHYAPTGALPLVQEFSKGYGVNVTVVADRGRPLAMVPYEKVRELPLTGGVSVLRRTVVLDETLQNYITRLLEAAHWHGVAMIEFKFDPDLGRYVLMEINGRFCASTALVVDAGVNIPYLLYRLYSNLPVAPSDYEVGIHERWIQGDFTALIKHLRGETRGAAAGDAYHELPSRSQALLDFLTAFRPGTRYDEFRWNDPRPGLFEIMSWREAPVRVAKSAVRRVLRA